jgi:hypothetical protein
MSVESSGENLADVIRPLVSSGAKFFGRQMLRPQAVADDRARVITGEPQVIGPVDPNGK